MGPRRPPRESWELAGFVDVERGGLGRPLALGRFWGPDIVDLDEAGEGLVWPHGGTDTGRYRAADPRMLDAFVVLADAPAERILAYARRYGVLGLCEHGLPMSHNWAAVDPDQDLLIERLHRGEPLDWDRLTRATERCFPRQLERHWWEPLAGWRRYAGQARALLTIAAHLQAGRPAPADDWRALGETEQGFAMLEALNPGTARTDLPLQRWLLQHHLNTWLQLAAVQPRVEWHDPHALHLRLDAHGVFGALAVQLVTAIGRVEGVALCSGCGRSYSPSRTSAAGRRNYCPDCRAAGVPARHAARAYRQHRRAGGGASSAAGAEGG